VGAVAGPAGLAAGARIGAVTGDLAGRELARTAKDSADERA
jgi:hypothetical protein